MDIKIKFFFKAILIYIFLNLSYFVFLKDMIDEYYLYPQDLMRIVEENNSFTLEEVYDFNFDKVIIQPYNNLSNQEEVEKANILGGYGIVSPDSGKFYELGYNEYMYTRICFFYEGKLVKVFQISSEELIMPPVTILPADVLYSSVDINSSYHQYQLSLKGDI